MRFYPFAFGCGVAQRCLFLVERLKNIAHFRMVVDAEDEMRFEALEYLGQFLEISQVEIVIVIWGFIVRWVKVKQGASPIVSL